MNKYRVTAHHIVFFIFIVSNVGGCLTPIGDPPLFLGYLKGVPFWWVAEHCWPMWAHGPGHAAGDVLRRGRLNFRRAPRVVREKWQTAPRAMAISTGCATVFPRRDSRRGVHQPPALSARRPDAGRGGGSYFTTRKPVHEANHFNFHPIQEVAILFVGIFATMMPALDWLQANAATLRAEARRPAPAFSTGAPAALQRARQRADVSELPQRRLGSRDQ